MDFMNKEIKYIYDENMKCSKILCDELNKDTNDCVIFTPIATSESIGVMQLLDKEFLYYNKILFKDTFKELELFKQVAHVYVSLGTGNFETVIPNKKEREMYSKFKEYGWVSKVYDPMRENDDGLIKTMKKYI